MRKNVLRLFLSFGLALSVLTLSSCVGGSSKTGGESTTTPTVTDTTPNTSTVETSTPTTDTAGALPTTIAPTTVTPTTSVTPTTTTPTTVVTGSKEKIKFTKQEGLNESAYVEFKGVYEATSYNVYINDKKLTEKDYFVQVNNDVVRIDLLGLKSGEYQVKVVPVFNGAEDNTYAEVTSTLNVKAYDRSGYAHFNYNEGVGAYNNDGTLKDNAIVLYVTDENKNSVTLSYNNKTVSGIGNILNSVGQACGEAGHENECKKVSDGKTIYGKANTNQGILLDLAQNNIPLVVRFVGVVSNSGLYQSGKFDAAQEGLIEGLTAYDKVDFGGSEGDNGHMARMKSAKNITFEGVGDNAVIDGWGFHLICETAYKDLAKNFEVRNLTFINTPEDAIGMEGQEQESTLTITASVERCWVHHNSFISPKIDNPAESDKGEGDGSCDFKRGRYFTCSYNYFEECHKTNLVGSSKTSVQFNMSYHHNIWYNCAARQPLARRGNIHFYNNLIIGTTDTVSSLRADAYMYAENNYYLGCSRPVECKSEGTAGVCKSYGNVLIGCYNDYSAQVVKTREEAVTSKCADGSISYANFDTNPNVFYYDSVNKVSDCYLTSADEARLVCLAQSGSGYRTGLNKAKLGLSTNITSTSSSTTISNDTTLTIGKGKGAIKVFTVTTPVILTVSATSSSGFDTGYLVKMNGELVLKLTSAEQQVILQNGEYVFLSSICLTANSKNDKETTITKCVFEKYEEGVYEQNLVNGFNELVNSIPSPVTYTDETYNKIQEALQMYSKFNADVKAMVNVESVNEKLNQYKLAGIAYVEGLIDLIETPVTDSNKDKLKDAKDALKALKAKFDDVVISNISKLEEAESSQSGEQVETEEAIRWSCDGKYTAAEVTTSGNQDKKKTLEVDGVTYTSSLKMESKTGVITITITSDKTLTVYQTGGTSLKVDGQKVAVGDLVNYELKAGTHTIAKGDGSAYVFLIVLE